MLPALPRDRMDNCVTNLPKEGTSGRISTRERTGRSAPWPALSRCRGELNLRVADNVHLDEPVRPRLCMGFHCAKKILGTLDEMCNVALFLISTRDTVYRVLSNPLYSNGVKDLLFCTVDINDDSGLFDCLTLSFIFFFLRFVCLLFCLFACLSLCL